MSANRDSTGHIVYQAFVSAWAVASVILLFLVLYWARIAVLLAFAGVLLALTVGGLVELLARYVRVPRAAALAIVCVGMISLVTGLFWWIGPRIAEQLQTLSERVPAALDQLREQLVSEGWTRWPSVSKLWESAVELVAPTLGMLRGAVGILFALLALFFFGLYLAAKPQRYLGLLLRIIPIGRRDRIREVLIETGRTLQIWLVTRAICMLEVGILTAIGLALLGVDVFIALGVLAGLLNFVPNFGPVIAAVPAVLIAILAKPMTALWVVVLYAGVQIVDNYLVTPLLQQHTVALPPALGLISQIILGLLLGPLGLLLATPLTVAAGVFVRRLYIEEILDDHSSP